MVVFKKEFVNSEVRRYANKFGDIEKCEKFLRSNGNNEEYKSYWMKIIYPGSKRGYLFHFY